jgi:hypothetical protein
MILNRKGSVRLAALIDAGKFVDRPWSFSAKDSNEMLGDPPAWVDYAGWFLGIDSSADKETKAAYSYPYGKAGKVYLSALRAIASRAAQAGDGAIADFASKQLQKANAMIKEKAQASGAHELTLVASATIEAAAAGADGKKRPGTFSATAYTGGSMKLKGWQFPVVVDLESRPHRSRAAGISGT